MEIRKDRGIILSARYSGEADLYAVIFMENSGKGSFIFKGLKKSVRRSHLVVNPGTVIEMNYYYSESKQISVISEYSVIFSPERISGDLEKILLLHLMLECARETAGEHDPNGAVFKYTAAAVNILAETQFKYQLSFFYLLNLLKSNGILPDFTHCVRCENAAPDVFTISADEKGIICGRCCQLMENNLLSLGKIQMSYIRASIDGSFHTLNHGLISQSETLIALKALTDFIEKYYHTVIKSKKTLLEIAQE
jgi:DNA repair protein RecO (recombination protein O)